MTQATNGWVWRSILAASLALNVAGVGHVLFTLDHASKNDVKDVVTAAVSALDFPVDPYLESIKDHLNSNTIHEGDKSKRDRIRQVIKEELDGRLTAIEKNQENILTQLQRMQQ